MECHEARLLIDERVHGALAGEPAAGLDEHLQSCADCREDLRQLTKLRELLNAAKNDAPPEGALIAIWQTVHGTTASAQTAKRRRMPMSAAAMTARRFDISVGSRWQRWRKAVAITLGAAALLMVAFMLGVAQQSHNRPIQEALQKDGYRWSNRIIARSDAPMSPPSVAAPPAETPSTPAGGIAGESLDDVVGMAGKDSPGAGGGWGGGQGQPATAKAKAGYVFEAPQNARDMKNAPSEAAPNAPPLRSNNADEIRKLQDVTRKQQQAAGGKDGETKGAEADAQKNLTKPKIIKTGELTVEVKNYVEAGRAVDALVVKYQGFVADSRTYDLPGATKRGEIVIRVAPEKFEELFAELKKLGAVLQERAGGQDITAAYTDTEARIKNSQIAEERLQDLIKSKTFMDKIQSLLEVERELSRVRGEIESMQGQMRVWQNQLSLSTIRLTLQEPSRSVPSGSLSVEVPGLTEAKKSLDAAITNAGGQLLSGQTSKRGDGTLMGNYTLRVKFARFAELVVAIKALGRTQDEHIQNQPFGASVPEGAQDVQCDLMLVLFERSIQQPNGSLNLEVVSLPEAMSKLDVALAAAQASIVNSQTQRQGDGSTYAQITLRVRSGNFSTLVDALPALGRTTQRTVNGEAGKILGGAADVPATLSLYLSEQRKQVPSGHMSVEVGSFTEARDKLSALIKEQGLQVLGSDSQQRGDGTWTGSFRLGIKAEKMDSTVSQLEKFGRVTTRQLQGLGLGDLSKVDPNVVGEVVLVFGEKPALAPQEEGSFRLMLRDTFGGFLSSMGYVIRGFGMLLPWAVLAGLIIWLAVRYSRRTPQAQTSPSAAPKAEAPKTDAPKN